MQKLKTAFRRFLRSWRLPRSPDGQHWVVFDDGRVAFLAPSDYATHREPNETIAVYPPIVPIRRASSPSATVI